MNLPILIFITIENIICFAIGIVVLAFFYFSYAHVALKDPGLISRDLSKYSKEFLTELIRSKNRGYCEKCRIVRQDPNTTHCSICEVCVEGYDHHCAWSGKCIGKGNLLAFNLFTGSIIVVFLYFIISIILVQALK